MASHDLEIIEKIKKATGRQLRRVDNLDNLEFLERGYIVNEQDQVTALRLHEYNLDDADILLLKELRQLQTLDLHSNHISDISFLKDLNQLQTLNLRYNHISDISFLKELFQLQTLNLSGNQINNISFLKNLVQLWTLDLNSNQINDISSLKHLVRLQKLYLSNNQISSISFPKELIHLQTLDLNSNHISDISFPKDLSQLQVLYLSDNQISDSSFLKELVQLCMLDLNFNQINDISFIKDLIQLQTLNLSDNQISSLPEWVAELSPEIVYSDSLWEQDKINVGNNPLTHPPPEIINQGREAIRAYFRSFEKSEAVTLHESKVLLVGEGEAGKTSLLKQFQGQDFDEHESQTHGINVQPLSGSEIAGFANPDQDCRLHFWDFGGQEIMHASHRFFMSSRSLYILVLDSRDDTGKCHWRWLRHIEKYGGQSPLIVAMNKIDANPSFNLEQKSINARFAQIENRFFRISCKNKDGLPELVRSMAASVPKTPLYGFEISKAWLEIRKLLEEATTAQNYISQEQFIAICKEHEVEDEESRITLLKLFNDLGTLLFFEQIKLADIYVLDPHWVTVGVYKIINSARTKDGILHEEDLDFILKQEDIRCDEYDPAKEKCFTYSVQEQAYLVRIMEEFELCYRYDKHQHILPNQLPKEPEQEPKLRGRQLLGFVMEYDYLPSSLFSRLMVRLKEDIPDRRQQWRYGMYLENKHLGVETIIKMQEQTNRITISIQGGRLNKRQYLAVIRHAIDGLGFQELKPKELVELPGHPGCFVKYSVLLGHEKHNVAEYFEAELGKYFPVSELLDSVVSKEERIKEGINIVNNNYMSDFGKSEVHITQTNTQTNSQQQSVDLLNQLREAQGLFRNLKEDILAEADIEIEDEKEKKRVENELEKAEKALIEAESAAEQGKELDAATKSRLKQFFDSLADKSSRLGKALEFVDQGTKKVQELARTYNKVAANIGLPAVPPLLLGKEKE